MAQKDVIYRITIITRREKQEELRVAMQSIGATSMTVTSCSGCGVQKATVRYYRGAKKEVRLLPKVKFEIVVSEIPVEDIISKAREVLCTGEIGDGKIFVEEEERAIKIRTQEEGADAL